MKELVSQDKINNVTFLCTQVNFISLSLSLMQTFASLHETTKIRLLSQAWSDLFVLGLAQAKKVRKGLQQACRYKLVVDTGQT